MKPNPIKFNPPKPTEKRFQSGIYNYCDRWCERCPDTDKCFLFAKEEQRKAEHIAKGEDINDPEIMWKDIEDSFKETHQLLNKAMKERGITQEDLEQTAMEIEEEKEPDFQSHPLVKITTKYLKTTHQFLNEFYFEQQKIADQFSVEISMDDIKDEIETISWYHTMLATKTWRLLYEIHTTSVEKDGELKEIMEADIPKFFALVNKCISKSQDAVASFNKKRKMQPERVKKMLELLGQVKVGVAKLDK